MITLRKIESREETCMYQRSIHYRLIIISYAFSDCTLNGALNRAVYRYVYRYLCVHTFIIESARKFSVKRYVPRKFNNVTRENNSPKY